MGDVLTFNVGSSIKVVEVLSCGSRRVSAKETALLYNEMFSKKNQIMNSLSQKT
ncbi:MAG: ribosomal 50S subunit-recycling heat shock protein [Paracoccaceae bacterium]